MTIRLSPADLYQSLIDNDVGYFCGVPDSSLSSFGHYLESHAKKSHDVAINEGNAVALAIGYYLATSKIPLVYMQNSGLGNATNPLISLADPLIMGVPMILLIGWRGQPGKKDEPQHVKQGMATISLLDSLGIPHQILASDAIKASKQVQDVASKALQTKQPFALLVQADTLQAYKANHSTASDFSLSREEAIQRIVDGLTSHDIIVATTGKASRELFEYRQAKRQSHQQDLLTVGGMGHASAIAYSIAKQKPKRKVFVIDGDGAVLMHMGSLAFIGSSKQKNFYHLVINNGAHQSVGGQPTIAHDVDLPGIAKASGYSHVYSLSKREEVAEVLCSLKDLAGPVFVEINTNSLSRPDLIRPTIHPSKNKEAFMKFLGENS